MLLLRLWWQMSQETKIRLRARIHFLEEAKRLACADLLSAEALLDKFEINKEPPTGDDFDCVLDLVLRARCYLEEAK